MDVTMKSSSKKLCNRTLGSQNVTQRVPTLGNYSFAVSENPHIHPIS